MRIERAEITLKQQAKQIILLILMSLPVICMESFTLVSTERQLLINIFHSRTALQVRDWKQD